MENRTLDHRRRGGALVALLLDTEDDHRGRKPALLAAVVLHLLLITVTLPSMVRESPQPPPPKPPVRISSIVLQPPPLQRTIPTSSQRPLEARRIPIPDPEPDRMEPAREALPAPRVDPTAPSVDVYLGAPQAPPAPSSLVYRPGMDGVTFPAILRHTQILPRYPRLARKSGVTGRVVLEAVVQTDGSVGDIEVLQTPGANLGFEEAAIEAVLQWRYRPGMQNGRPAAVRFTIFLDFKLE